MGRFRCASWIANGFCTNANYTTEQRKNYCGVQCVLLSDLCSSRFKFAPALIKWCSRFEYRASYVQCFEWEAQIYMCERRMDGSDAVCAIWTAHKRRPAGAPRSSPAQIETPSQGFYLLLPVSLFYLIEGPGSGTFFAF